MVHILLYLSGCGVCVCRTSRSLYKTPLLYKAHIVLICYRLCVYLPRLYIFLLLLCFFSYPPAYRFLFFFLENNIHKHCGSTTCWHVSRLIFNGGWMGFSFSWKACQLVGNKKFLAAVRQFFFFLRVNDSILRRLVAFFLKSQFGIKKKASNT